MGTTTASLPERLKGIDFLSLPQLLRGCGHYLYVLTALYPSRQPGGGNRIHCSGGLHLQTFLYHNIGFDCFAHYRVVSQKLTSVTIYNVNIVAVFNQEPRRVSEPTPRDINDPTNTRGWTFQKRVLLLRMIDFSTTHVIWTCQFLRSTEAGCQLGQTILQPALSSLIYF